jgi:hypothetical protein
MLSWQQDLLENGEFNSHKDVYTYDEQSKLTSVWSYEWSDSSWIPKDKQHSYWFYSFTLNDSAGNNYSFGDAWYNLTLKYRQIITGVETKDDEIVVSYFLSQNYPNPFNPSTKIKYNIPNRSNVILRIYDILGKEIETLVNEEKSAGLYEINWNASKLSSGVYFYQIKAGEYISTKKMILLK